MTIEQLVGLPVADLEQMTNSQLEQFLAPYFPSTRPVRTITLESLLPQDMLAELKAFTDSRPKLDMNSLLKPK